VQQLAIVIAYLQNERKTNADDYPFILELAHYEWVEMALSIAQEELAETNALQPGNLQQTLSHFSVILWHSLEECECSS
jgi:hypothetical protein